MSDKNQKIGRGKGRKDRCAKGSGTYRGYRIAVPGFGPLTIFAESAGQARTIARRLNGLRRLMADLMEIKAELGVLEAKTEHGLLTFYDRESRQQLAGPEFSGPLRASVGGDVPPGKLN